MPAVFTFTSAWKSNMLRDNISIHIYIYIYCKAVGSAPSSHSILGLASNDYYPKIGTLISFVQEVG